MRNGGSIHLTNRKGCAVSENFSAVRPCRTAVLAVAPLLCAVAAAVAGLPGDSSPALSRYPSPAELQRRADELSRANPAGWRAARQDFDLAIRSHFVLGDQAPKVPWPERPEPHVLPKWPRLTSLPTRQGMLDYIGRLEAVSDARPAAEFYRAHLEDYCLDDSPHARVVLGDVLLNGWHDWSDWEGEKLAEVRAKFPEVHRAYALQLARYFRIAEYHGIILRMLVSLDTPEYLRSPAQSVLMHADCNVDVLDFLVAHGVAAEDEAVRQSLFSCMGPISQDIDAYVRRSFWIPYLDSADSMLRDTAAGQLNTAIEAIRWKSGGDDTSEELTRKLDKMAENDPDEWNRKQAALRKHGREQQLAKEAATGMGPKERAQKLRELTTQRSEPSGNTE